MSLTEPLRYSNITTVCQTLLANANTLDPMAAEYLQTHGVDLQYEIDRAELGTLKRAGTIETLLKEIRLPNHQADVLWDVTLRDGKIKSLSRCERMQQQTRAALNPGPSLLLPSLCHPHIHLDKCFLLSHPKYDDLEIVQGGFGEALELTSEAKSRFDEDDLIERGTWLIEESIAAGVTHMRTFVEVDTTVRFKCLDAGLKLKQQFKGRCDVQICVFAQDPIFSPSKNHPEGRSLIEEALSREGIDVLGSTPYVEESPDLMKANVDWAVSTAVNHRKHLDLHLDYNIDPETPPLIDYVIDQLHQDWISKNQGKTIVLGHCTRLTLFAPDEWHQLKARMANLPIYFVGLPTSDLFMMGKPDASSGGGHRVRGTLQIPQMIQEYGLKGAIAINNIGNAFTPQGNGDPLSIASMGVGIYQAGTKEDARVLYECVSSCAKTAIGYPQPHSPLTEGAPADFVLVRNGTNDKIERPRELRTFQDVIYHPPSNRQTFMGGCSCS
ncbi:MAG: hypothetical protein Q9191_001455 [Dirinaria sp. TL-2023a]